MDKQTAQDHMAFKWWIQDVKLPDSKTWSLLTRTLGSQSLLTGMW